MARALAGLPQETADAYTSVTPVGWVPVRDVDAVTIAVANNFTSLDVVRETSNATPALAAGAVSVSSEFFLATYRR